MGCSFIASIQNAVGSVADVVAPVVAAVPGPWQVPAMAYMAVTTVQNGGSLTDVVKKIGLAYVAGQIGGAAGAAGDQAGAAAAYGTDLGSSQTAMLAAQDAGMGTAGDVAGNMLGSAAKSAVLGGNPLTALMSGGVGAGVNELSTQIPGFSTMPALAQNAVKSAMAAELQGKDPSQALMNQALAAGISASTGYTGGLPTVSLAKTSNIPATAVQNASTPAANAQAAKSIDTPITSVYTDPIAQTGGLATVGKLQNAPAATTNNLKPLYASILGGTMANNPDIVAQAPKQQTLSELQNMNANPSSAYYAQGGLVQHFASGGESAKVTTDENGVPDIVSSLNALGSLSGPVAQSHGLMRLGQTGVPYSPRVLPQLAALLQSRGMRMAHGGDVEEHPGDREHPNYDGSPVFRTGGLDGLGGKYVEGKGDGTSDDISAMLANGEYVFSADVVSALGNGSNKAGADKLSEMVEAIRARARSAPPDKLPPDAKSPLEYLKSAKGKKNG